MSDFILPMLMPLGSATTFTTLPYSTVQDTRFPSSNSGKSLLFSIRSSSNVLEVSSMFSVAPAYSKTGNFSTRLFCGFSASLASTAFAAGSDGLFGRVDVPVSDVCVIGSCGAAVSVFGSSETAVNAAEAKEKEAEKPQQNLVEKLPVFEYAGATENIDDTSKTFDELRIEKSADFPELEDGKRVSWAVEYGKITKTVADPKGTSIGKMKSDIETSKEFQDSLKKPRVDKNPACKIKPRVTAQSKGTMPSYKVQR
jgi:hypothetical protein